MRASSAEQDGREDPAVEDASTSRAREIGEANFRDHQDDEGDRAHRSKEPQRNPETQDPVACEAEEDYRGDLRDEEHDSVTRQQCHASA